MDLKQLINITPMAEDYKKEIVSKLDSLTPDQIYELTDLCWSTISEAKKNQLIFAREKYMADMALGKKKYNAKDLDEIETKVDYEWADKIEQAEVLNTVAGLKDQNITASKSKPLPQDKVSPPTAPPAGGPPQILR